MYASPRDTLKGREGMPVFSEIYLKGNKVPLTCYVEYHDLFKEYFNAGVVGYIRTCSNYKFLNKDIQTIYFSQIDSMKIARDIYKRILIGKNDTVGILAKRIYNNGYYVYEYMLDDYKDLQIKDSTKSTGFGIGAKNLLQHYIIFDFNNTFYLYSFTGISNDQFKASQVYTLIVDSKEMYQIIKQHDTTLQQNPSLLTTYFNRKDILKYFQIARYEKKL